MNNSPSHIFNQKKILITGASGGIGSVLAEKLAELGAELILIGRNKSKLEQMADKHKGGQYYICDFTEPGAVEKLVKKISCENRTLDMLFNVAGVAVYKDVNEATIQDWEDSFDVNVTAPFILIKQFLDSLQKSERPIVINVGSGAGTMGMKGRSVYVATKFALRGLSLSLTEELKDNGLKVVLITLGSTLTGLGPLTVEEKIKLSKEGRAYFTPEWVADKLIEIVSSENLKEEYVLYPTDFGMGEWKKP
ncbi:SDR family oxidoreductase [Candidatus Dojkabacteria bacterium]|nr:SDR family oxidoreductase [Candidatus Dojkabacteria bacterium]